MAEYRKGETSCRVGLNGRKTRKYVCKPVLLRSVSNCELGELGKSGGEAKLVRRMPPETKWTNEMAFAVDVLPSEGVHWSDSF